jgi:hypothetical protein
MKGILTKMKIIFMGTPDFSVPTLDAIKKDGNEIVLVVTQLEKKKEKKKKKKNKKNTRPM